MLFCMESFFLPKSNFSVSGRKTQNGAYTCRWTHCVLSTVSCEAIGRVPAGGLRESPLASTTPDHILPPLHNIYYPLNHHTTALHITIPQPMQTSKDKLHAGGICTTGHNSLTQWRENQHCQYLIQKCSESISSTSYFHTSY